MTRYSPCWAIAAALALACALLVADEPASVPVAHADDNAAAPAPARAPNVLHAIEDAVTGIADTVRPSVVEVIVEHEVVLPPAPPIRRSVALSGVVWDDQGHVVSLGRVFEGATGALVVFAGGQRAAAEILATDDDTGVAVLKVDASALPAGTLVAAPRGSSAALRPGSIVVQIGNPFGLAGSVAIGNVSGIDRVVKRGERALPGVLQVTTPINPGDAGSALCDASGRVVGIVASSYERGADTEELLRIYAQLVQLGERLFARPAERQAQTKPPAPGGAAGGEPEPEADPERLAAGHGSAFGGQSVGFAIPTDQVEDIAARLIARGGAPRTWIGVRIVALDPVLVAQLDLPVGRGLLVVDVVAGGPADLAGIRRHDILLSYGGGAIEDASQLKHAVLATAPGTSTALGYLRGGERAEVPIVPAIKPSR